MQRNFLHIQQTAVSICHLPPPWHFCLLSYWLPIHCGTRFCAAAAAKALQSCPTLCDPTDGSPPGSPVSGILQARTLEWVAISFSNACKWKVKVKTLSCIWPSATPWTTAFQAPPSMGFYRQEYWSGVPLPSPVYIYIFWLALMDSKQIKSALVTCFRSAFKKA